MNPWTHREVIADRVNYWRSIHTIPTQTVVRVKTVTGIICRAITYPRHGRTRWVRRPSKHRHYYSVMCYRLDRTGKTTGDVAAIAWGQFKGELCG